MIKLRTTAVEQLPPDDAKVADIFARLGYKFADAVADLVDNSVDAEADAVHIRFMKSNRGIQSVLIADNGWGMDAEGLREAMRFGSRTSKTGRQLGKYGIGLKSASLSQADVVSVLTRTSHSVDGRRWSLPRVKAGWECELLNTDDVREQLKDSWGPFRIKNSGTVVIWERLEHLQALPDTVDEVLQNTTKDLLIELGIRFHRFLENGSLTITIDQQLLGDEPTGVHVSVKPLNPFEYENAPVNGYPTILPINVAGMSMPIECHIWPPKTSSPGYRLGGGKVALRQGFYFYRNDRLIQAGGWNGARADDGEPHLSLARVRIELPDALDSLFKLEVTKMSLHPTPEFMQALKSAKGDGGATFDRFILDAQKAYRRQKDKEGARFPMVPGQGISRNAQKAIGRILEEPGAGKPQTIHFRWTQLDADELFRIKPGEPEISINSRYRRDLSEGERTDAPVLKVALMFLLQGEIRKQFATQPAEKWMQRVNQALIAALKA